MTKISQLADIGGSLAANDEFIIRDVSDASTPSKKVTASGFFNVATALGFTRLDLIRSSVSGEASVQVFASGLAGRTDTTLSGVVVARSTISGYQENASANPAGAFFPVVTLEDIGTAPNEVPLNGFLGEMAYVDFLYLRGASDTTTTSGTVAIDALVVERFNYTASIASGITVTIANLQPGREVKAYLRNTNATARAIAIQASTSGTGFVDVNLAPNAPPGAASVSGVTLSGTTGTSVVWVANIAGAIVGGLS